MVQEEVENKTVNLVISTTKLSFNTLLTALKKMKQMHDNHTNQPKHGKQTVKQLIGQNQGVSNLAVDSTGIKGFEKVARKYGVDFAIRKDKSHSPPRYLVFFKARDADAITSAFQEYADKRMRRDKPSVREELHKVVDAPDIARKPHVKEKVQAR